MKTHNSPLLIHIPHASVYIPEEERRFCIPDLNTELLNMTDLYTDELFGGPYDSIRFPVSRLVCDPERFRDDASERMSAVGMGAVYTRTSSGAVLRQADAAERERILQRYYDPHHPAVMELIAMTVRNAHDKGIHVGICGELASDIEMMGFFREIGIDELSVAPSKLLEIKMNLLGEE